MTTVVDGNQCIESSKCEHLFVAAGDNDKVKNEISVLFYTSYITNKNLKV